MDSGSALCKISTLSNDLFDYTSFSLRLNLDIAFTRTKLGLPSAIEYC